MKTNQAIGILSHNIGLYSFLITNSVSLDCNIPISLLPEGTYFKIASKQWFLAPGLEKWTKVVQARLSVKNVPPPNFHVGQYLYAIEFLGSQILTPTCNVGCSIASSLAGRTLHVCFPGAASSPPLARLKLHRRGSLHKTHLICRRQHGRRSCHKAPQLELQERRGGWPHHALRQNAPAGSAGSVGA